MGDMSEYYRDQELKHHLNMSSKLKQAKNKPQFEQWVTASNDTINIKDMTSLHLKNSINKIKREGWRQEWLEPLEKELQLRRDSFKLNNSL